MWTQTETIERNRILLQALRGGLELRFGRTVLQSGLCHYTLDRAGLDTWEHRHPHYELSLLISGEMHYSSEEFSKAEILLHPGEWILIAPGLPHRRKTRLDNSFLLGFALLFNIAGFDLIYALQDIDFDKAHKLHSVPAKFGRRMTLAIAACSFALSAVFLTSVGVVFKLNAVYAACVAVIACLYVFGVITIALFGVKKTQLVFLYESVSISGLIFLGIASNLF